MMQLFFRIGLLAGIIWLLAGCSDNENSVGETLLGSSRINVNYVEDANVSISNKKDESSDLSSISKGLLGTLNDEVFGKTRSGFAFQLRLPGAVKLKDPSIDSVKLFLNYENYYGLDTLLKQTAKVYLLKDDIQYAKVYNAATEISSMIGEQVGSEGFNKKFVSDTVFLKSKIDEKKDSVINDKKQVDTIIRHLAITLDKERVGQYILNASETDFESSSNFINYFKGLYVNTEDVSATQGVIYGFNMYNSYLRLYFKNRRNAEAPNDTMYNTSFALPITDNSTRFNRPVFLQDKVLSTSSQYIYLQGIHGTKAIIEMPELQSWKDSTKVSVNKATLTFKIATDSTEAKKYPLPYRLELAAVDKEGKKSFLLYSSNSGNVPNGLLNAKDYIYTFHIPEFLQNIVDGKVTFDHFELSTGAIEQRVTSSGGRTYPTDAKNTAARVILFNEGEHKPKLKISYTKY